MQIPIDRGCNGLKRIGQWATVVLLVSLLFSQQGSADVVVSSPTVHSSLRAASEAAAADQSLVLLVFGAEWCGPCKMLKTRTLSSREFKEQGGALHVVEIDIDSDANTAREFGVEAVPTLVILTADSKIVARRVGFMETADLLLWLKESRERVKEGKWEGTVPGSKLTEFIKKASADQLEATDLARLVLLLGEQNPADRDAAAKLLIGQREQSVPPLIDALTNSYLGVRVGATETLHKLAPDSASIDPWLPPSELAEDVAELRKWWAGTGKLPAQPAEKLPDNISTASINNALESLRGGDPVQRTKAMSTLIAFGKPALPTLREAIKQSEKTGDQRSLSVLEDVRWTILIPAEVEQQVGSVRNLLARGKGTERQDAATRLGKAGTFAIPALAELLDDSDGLVVENAVRALSNIGGNDSIPAVAALLKAGDSNLRMTAAQALGHTKNNSAIKDLLTVINDSNEVVVCTALSALDEINGDNRYSSSRKTQPPEVIQGLKSCLADSRWRVRAAAAELTGKLGLNQLVKELSGLLTDPDGFVVKNSLEALQKLGAAPEPNKLLAVAQQHSDLRRDTIEILERNGTDEAVKAITELYHAGTLEERIALVRNLGTSQQPNQDTSPWQPLLSQIVAESAPALRCAAAQILAAQPPKVAAALVGNLLSDVDEETRSAAAGAVLSIIGRERQVIASSHGTSISEFVVLDEMENSFGTSIGNSRRKAPATNEPPATAEQISSWHAALQQGATKSSNLVVAAAWYVTGASNSDLPAFKETVEHADQAGLDKLSHSAAMSAIVPRLPWPDAKPVVERFCSSPGLFLKMISYTQQAPAGLSDFVFEPERFKAAVEPASQNDINAILQRAMSFQQKGWSLLSINPRNDTLVAALLNATNAAWRATAVYCLGTRSDAKSRELLERALGDSNAWVRVAAVSSVSKIVKDRPALERLLGPLLTDSDKKVVAKAAIGLLEPEIRAAAELNYAVGSFEFEKIHVWTSIYEPNNEQRPLTTLEGNPAFLETVRQKLAGGSAEEIGLAALLLAQYADFSGLDRLVNNQKAEDQWQGVLSLTAISLSHDAKYLPYLKKMTASAKDDQEFRRLLQALRGMNGTEARELRLAINKRMRDGGHE
jgi:HEAT repeat protein